jgi:alpha-D-ribose 1-methylphosphonate 5-triphosphate synthase subunit PhnH
MIRETAYDPVVDAQRHFRLLLDSMARPGKLNRLDGPAICPPAGLGPGAALIGLALLNADVSFFAGNNPDAITDYLVSNTATRPAPLAKADFLFLHGTDDPAPLEAAKIGTLNYPDTNALAVIGVATLSAQPGPHTQALTLTGPGVKHQITVFVGGLHPALLHTLRAINAEYPLGIDTILTDAAGQICGLPRSIQLLSE